MFTLPVFAAEDEEEEEEDGLTTVNNSDGVQFSDYWRPTDAQNEVENSEFKEPIDKFSNWGTYAVILIIVAYFGFMGILMFHPNPKQQSRGFWGMLIGLGAIVVFTCGTSAAFDLLN